VAALADLADAGAVARGGTDLGAALDAALLLLGETPGERTVIVLVTDGEDHMGRGLAAARRCRARGVRVDALGMGTALGGKIPRDEGAGGFLTDAAGAEVVSRLDSADLRRIAEATGGTFERAGEKSLVDLYEERILPRARAAFERGERRTREDRFQWPLLAAFLLWLLDLALAERTRR
jgi:Ca-activated chloride channel family protein